jgi:TolB-like protein
LRLGSLRGDFLSIDASQAFFSHGITEDVITALDRLRWVS